MIQAHVEKNWHRPRFFGIYIYTLHLKSLLAYLHWFRYEVEFLFLIFQFRGIHNLQPKLFVAKICLTRWVCFYDPAWESLCVGCVVCLTPTTYIQLAGAGSIIITIKRSNKLFKLIKSPILCLNNQCNGISLIKMYNPFPTGVVYPNETPGGGPF